jgi:hypothetical protein
MLFNSTQLEDGVSFTAASSDIQNLKFYTSVEPYVEAVTPPTELNQFIFEVYKQSTFIVDIGFSLRWTNPGVGIMCVQFDFPLNLEANGANLVPNIKVPVGDGNYAIIPVTSLPSNYDTIVSPVKTASIFENGIRTRPKSARSWLLYEGGILKIHLEADHGLSYAMTGCSSECRYQQNILPVYN